MVSEQMAHKTGVKIISALSIFLFLWTATLFLVFWQAETSLTFAVTIAVSLIITGVFAVAYDDVEMFCFLTCFAVGSLFACGGGYFFLKESYGLVALTGLAAVSAQVLTVCSFRCFLKEKYGLI